MENANEDAVMTPASSERNVIYTENTENNRHQCEWRQANNRLLVNGYRLTAFRRVQPCRRALAFRGVRRDPCIKRALCHSH
jgi:hypothetical protein